MKKIIILFSILQFCFLNPAIIKSQQPNKTKNSKCLCCQSKVRFDDSSLEKIILNPEDVIAHPDEFWASDPAYKLVKLWHKKISFPVPIQKWVELIEPFKNYTHKKRQTNPQLVAARTMIKYEKEFNENAIPFICSFLPKNCPDISTTIYFTTAIIYSSFQIGNNIVIYGPLADKDNLLIHELFHQGFEKCKPTRHENGIKDSTLNQIYNDLQNEGMATFAGYKGLKQFPNIDPDPLKDDYRFLKDNEKFSQLLNELNDLLKNFPSLIEKEVGKRILKYNILKVGTTDRAYDVIGCFMAMKIDEKLGRDALVATISKGPDSFVKTYNSIVEEKLKVTDLFDKKR